MQLQSLGDPLWRPEDARQTARDAAGHRTYPGVAARDVGRSCGRCGAGPMERCDRSCGDVVGMRPNRARVIGRVLVLLASLIILLAVGSVWLAGAR